MTHHAAHNPAELTEYETAEKEYEALVREMELEKYDTHISGEAKAELADRIAKARARFEDVSHSVTGVVGPQTTEAPPATP
jgi:nicotinamide mononucleotide (NMN) deamidase PncC